jgi:hypothetical protein
VAWVAFGMGFGLMIVGALAWFLESYTEEKAHGVFRPAPSPRQEQNSVDVSEKSSLTKYCKHCGSKIDSGSSFCEKCGKRIIGLRE